MERRINGLFQLLGLKRMKYFLINNLIRALRNLEGARALTYPCQRRVRLLMRVVPKPAVVALERLTNSRRPQMEVALLARAQRNQELRTRHQRLCEVANQLQD